MRLPQKNVHNNPDFKDKSGKWSTGWSVNDGEYNWRYFTRSQSLWMLVQSRCRTPSKDAYIGCQNIFKDFQTFASWCQTQHGYTNKEENGNHWSIDKDIFFPGNKVYSPDTCCFVPNAVNGIFISRDRDRGPYPLGVHLEIKSGKYVAQCSGRSPRFIGRFLTEASAHAAWQEAKIEVIRRALERGDLGERARLWLNLRIQCLSEDWQDGEITHVF